MKIPPIVLAGGLAALALTQSKAIAAAVGGRLTKEQVAAIVDKIGSAYFPKVDRRMVRAMVEIESDRAPYAFRPEPQVLRPSNASVGLMQTLITTAEWIYSDLGARAYGEPSLATLTDAETSVYFGMAYINWLRTYRNEARSEEWIVRAYNGGPGGATISATLNHWAKYQRAKQEV